MHNIMKVLNVTEVFTFKNSVLCYASFTPIKKKKNLQ